MKKIDCEFHYYHPELMEYLATRSQAPKYYPETQFLELRKNVKADFKTVTNKYSIMTELMDIGNIRAEALEKNGVDTAVISSSAALEELPEKEAVYFAKKTNDAVAEAVRKYKGRFIGSIVLPTLYVDEAIKELERCKKELGLAYWHTHSNYRDEHLYQEKYIPLLAKAEELGCAFYLHPHCSNDPDMCDEGYVYAAPGLGFTTDAIKTALRLILNGTFDKFPRLRMVLGHLGETMPFLMDRFDNRFAWIKDPEVKMQRKVSDYFKSKNVLVTTSGNMSKIAFECTRKAIGIDNIIFGSDYPYENLANMMKFMDSLDLSQEDQEKVYHLNVEKYIL